MESNPGVMMGKPVVRGTRVTVELIVEKLAAGRPLSRSCKRIRGSRGRLFSLQSNSVPSAKGGRYLSIVCRMMLSRGAMH